MIGNVIAIQAVEHEIDNSTDALIFSSFFGGFGEDGVVDLEIDSENNIIFVGHTFSTTLPVKNNFQQYFGGSFDAYVVKLSSDGQSIIFASYIGGSQGDAAVDVAIDNVGDIYVTGLTFSSNFPTKNAYKDSLTGSADGFITKISSEGELIYSTFFGGDGGDFLYGLGFDLENDFIFTGHTSSTNYPTTISAFDTSFNGEEDCILSILNSTGESLLYSSYFGGSLTDMGLCGFVDNELHEVIISGLTYSADLITTVDAIQQTHGGGMDAFISIFNLTDYSLNYSTYFGGNDTDRSFNIQYDSNKSLIFSGDTSSSNLPTTVGVLQENYQGESDGYITKLVPSRNSLSFCTYFGSDAYDFPNDFAIDVNDNILLIGGTASTDFYITDNAYQSTLKGNIDTFLSIIDSDGKSIVYSTFLGGSNEDEGNMLVLDSLGDVVIAGITKSSDFPVANSLDQSYGGSQDIFIGKFSSSIKTLALGPSPFEFLPLILFLLPPFIIRKRRDNQ
ncbi:MAG: SBBP repeat-containing protein [Candidatus Thorarchaeota archaeon]